MTLSDDSRRQRQPRGPGRPTAITTEQIAAAALDIGFRELTFAGVAERLGVGQATLYRHVPNRDELVRLGLDLAIRRVSWPDLNGPWRPLLERWSLASWHAWAAFPGAVIEATRGVIPPSLVRLSIQVGTALVERGFTPRDAVLAADLVFDLAVDSRRGVEALELTLES
ncbi:MAG: helix-turn-helix domain-containing protein, partial [Mycetocola sp.]